MTEQQYRCGYVALVGRPNVGKSTLLNRIIGQKISIVTRKPQTTRQRIAGIKSTPRGQVVYLDTPGIHIAASKALNRYMNRVAHAVLHDVDVVVFMVEAGIWTRTDRRIRKAVLKAGPPVVLAVNKIDRIADKATLLPFVEEISHGQPFADVMMISATAGDGVADLEQTLLQKLPFSHPFYDEDQITDRSERFLAAELIREQLTLRLHKELPYALTVELESFQRDQDLISISAVIWVERDSQKQIVIGKRGQVLKQVGAGARIAMEELLDCKVYLRLWVKVSRGWSDDERAMARFGYEE